MAEGLNTFSARHHLRLFPSAARWHGEAVWPISSTQDIGIGFSRQARNFIHLIDPTIDNERNKIVNDLTFTGCVDAVTLVPRPFLPKDARNATNDRLLTDGDMAVVQLNACARPRPFVDPPADVAAARLVGNPVQRGFRRFFLSMKHQLYRGNIVYLTVSRSVKGVKFLFGHREAPGEPERTLVIDGVPYTIAELHAPPSPRTKAAAGEGRVAEDAAEVDTPSVPPPLGATQPGARGAAPRASAFEPAPTVELFAGPSISRAESLGQLVIGFGGTGQSADPADDVTLLVTTPLEVKRAVGVSPMVTLHSSRWLSHEIAYDYSRADLRFDFTHASILALLGDGTPILDAASSSDPLTLHLVVRSLGYALVAHARPREARVRPYVLTGPVLTAYRLRDGGQQNSRLLGRAGLGNVGSVIGAIRSAHKPPLDGGTIYRWGITYGGGLRARLTDTWGLRVDLRETWISTPDFASIQPSDIPGTADDIAFAQESDGIRRRTLTFGATFSF